MVPLYARLSFVSRTIREIHIGFSAGRQSKDDLGGIPDEYDDLSQRCLRRRGEKYVDGSILLLEFNATTINRLNAPSLKMFAFAHPNALRFAPCEKICFPDLTAHRNPAENKCRIRISWGWNNGRR